ncbi:hypothetical protein HUW51_13905 [Adhaeribacter swui]|uniref:Uncharacterized protein n=1 Tax=Adhaeribacter swui TaxID=2086471 RepID=A0A7G7G9C6_9BACT|nr:hypothetical protein [Adhaeribacter swui]QNF33760.1 hypothetical protein HUW51_13905 [Adhaeribacter swui]
MNATFTTNIAETTSLTAAHSFKAVVLVNPEESLVQVSWSEAPAPHEVAACADYVASIISQYNLNQLLHDVRQVDYAAIDLQRCLTHEFCPKVMQAGITKLVHLANYTLPELFIIDQITDIVKQKYVKNPNTHFEICTTPEGAAAWFKNNIYSQKEKAAKAPETVKLQAPQAAVLNTVSPLQTLVKSYKEKANLLYKMAFKSKNLYPNI